MKYKQDETDLNNGSQFFYLLNNCVTLTNMFLEILKTFPIRNYGLTKQLFNKSKMAKNKAYVWIIIIHLTFSKKFLKKLINTGGNANIS